MRETNRSACPCRQGELSADALQQRFALSLDAEAPGMFLELADLLTSQEQRSELLLAAQQAGWTNGAGTAGAEAQEDSPLKVHSPSAGPPSCTVLH